MPTLPIRRLGTLLFLLAILGQTPHALGSYAYYGTLIVHNNTSETLYNVTGYFRGNNGTTGGGDGTEDLTLAPGQMGAIHNVLFDEYIDGPGEIAGAPYSAEWATAFHGHDYGDRISSTSVTFSHDGQVLDTYFGLVPVRDQIDGTQKNRQPKPCGMPVWRVSEPFISLWLEDEPLGYQPATGQRISLGLSFNQRESSLGLNPNWSSVGRRWNLSWLSYVGLDNNTNIIVQLPGGGQITFTGTNDYYTNTRITGDTTNGYTLYFPDGSQNLYQFVVTNSAGGFQNAFLTELRTAQAQSTKLLYSPTNRLLTARIQYVVDGDGLTNTLYYNLTNGFGSNLVTQVADAFGRTASFLYDNRGLLTNLTDVAGISTSFIYDNNDVVTNLNTPYGTTSFTYTETQTNQTAPNGRSMLVTEADGGHHLYLYKDSAPGVPSSTSLVPSTFSFTNTFDTTNLDVRNSFHWGRLQYAALSTTTITNFGTNDFLIAELRHWLAASNTVVGETVSLDRLSSPAAMGTVEGQKTWFDYAGKTNSQYEGAQSLPLFVAQVLPDGSTHMVRTDRNSNGFPTNEITSYSAGASILLRTNSFTYGPNGVDVVTITNALGFQISSNAYNAYHQILTNFNALGELTVLFYNTNQQVVSITEPSGLVTTNVYFSSGASSNRLASTTDYAIISGSPRYYSTNSYTWSSGLIATHTDPMGLTVTNTWDNLQRLRRVDFPDRTFITNAFSNLDLVQVVDRLGYSNSFGFNSVRQLVATTNANGLVTRYGYCSCGALNSVTNAFGTSLQNVTTYSWDLQGHMLQSLGPDLYTVTYNYNALGQLTNVYDGLASVTNWYNNQGLLVASSNAVGQVAAAVYDILDRATNAVDANTVTVTNTFDNLNRLLTRGYPDGGVEHYLYTLNVAGVTSYTNQLGTNVVNFTYDPLGRKTTEVYPGISTNSFGYDGANHLLTLTDGNHHTTSWTFDLYGRMLTKADATGTVILTNAYDPDNRLTNRWTIAKTNTIFSYDPAGNLTAVQYPVSHAINYYYDLLNRMTNMVDATGSSTYSYTVAGQLAGEDGPWTDDAVNYTYSTATRLRTGLNLLQPNSSPWVQSYSYDSAERLQSITSPAGSFGYSFDPVRQAMVNSLSLPNAAYITNSFDTVARLLGTVLKNSTNGVLNSHQYAYNLAGQRTYLTNTAGDYRNYIYDNAGQLTNVFGHESNGAGRVNEYLSYTYDPAGNLKTRYVFTTTETFNVNSLNELSSQFRSGSTFTVAGNTTSTATNVLLTPNGGFNYSITPNADNTWGVGVGLNNGTNNLVAVAQDALGRKDTNSVTCYLPATNLFTYDGNGNLLSDGNRNFAYDDENQLTSVWVTNGWRSDFVYDGKMRRRIRREYTWFSGAWLQTNEVHYIYDGNLVIQERDANNVPTLSYTRGRDLSGGLQGAGGIGGPLAMSQGSGASLQHSFYHADGNGNITALINSKQAIVARYLYDPFGNVLSKAGPLADANLYRFSSKEFHPTSGLSYYAYRFYDPGLQRWINRDPIEEFGGANLYRFVLNNPITGADGSGLLDYFYSKGSFLQPAGSVPYLEDTSFLGESAALVYNTVPLAVNASQALGRFIGKAFDDALDVFLPEIDPQQNPYAYAMSQTARQTTLAAALFAVDCPLSERPPASPAPAESQLEFNFVNGLGPAPKPLYPPNNGFLGSYGPATLVPGARIDRFGSDFGSFAAPEGTPFIQRSLPSSSATAPYSVFEVVKPIDVQAGSTAPWFGMPGQGVQYQFSTSIDQLINQGYLKPVLRANQ